MKSTRDSPIAIDFKWTALNYYDYGLHYKPLRHADSTQSTFSMFIWDPWHSLQISPSQPTHDHHISFHLFTYPLPINFWEPFCHSPFVLGSQYLVSASCTLDCSSIHTSYISQKKRSEYYVSWGLVQMCTDCSEVATELVISFKSSYGEYRIQLSSGKWCYDRE